MRQKIIVAMCDSEPREVPHEWFCLNVEVPEHLVDVPEANQLDEYAVDS